MKKFLKNNGIWLLAAAVLVAIGLNLVSFFSSNTNILSNVAGIIASPFRAAASSISGWVDDNLRFRSEFDALKEENAQLKQQLAQLEAQLRQAEVDSEENALLRELIGLREQRRDLSDFESAHVIDRSGSNWDYVLTLNRGSLHDVQINNCVIDASGHLAGVVTEVGLNWCRVRTVLDPELEIGASVFRTGEIGVAKGDLSLMPQGLLRLDYVGASSALMAGDLVVTSGLGGFYPSSLPSGIVSQIETNASGTGQYAVLTPSSDLDHLTEVFIIKSFEIVE